MSATTDNGAVPAELARRSLLELEAWGSARGWTGPDPYDGLNARGRLAAPLRRSVVGRRVITQAVKRSPLDLRPVLGIPSGRSPVTLAHAACAYARNGFLADDLARARLNAALASLRSLRCPAYALPAWGYHFDVQTRVFFYPRGAPNSIATSFAALALLDAHAATGDPELLALAEGAGDFFLTHVPQTTDGEGAFFGYLAGDRTPIHNANTLVCAVLAELWERTGRDDFGEAARRGLLYTLGHQRGDGSWPYGERADLSWVDNFHTGYVLESLIRCRRAGLDGGIAPALERGLRHYEDALFLPDGTPKYTPESVYPVDVQCAAQGIQTFALAAADDPRHLTAARRVFAYARARLRRRDGAVVFQRRRLWTNRTAHPRWGVAPMLHALTHLVEREAASG
jgi:hypothetical protein